MEQKAYCQTCGGEIGVFCFNPIECAEISRQTQEHYAAEEQRGVTARLESLERGIVAIGSFLLTHFEGAASMEQRAEEFRRVVANLKASGIDITKPNEPDGFDDDERGGDDAWCHDSDMGARG